MMVAVERWIEKEDVMRGFRRVAFAVVLVGAAVCAVPRVVAEETMVQAQAVLTVSESKRLIGKAVAQMPIVKNALDNGMVIVAKGTTNTYVAEEILGEDIVPGAFVIGITLPAKGGKRPRPPERMSELVLIKGEVQSGLSLADAVKRLKPGDVVIKGANALDYENKTAGVLIGSATSGTSGTIMPHVVGKKAHLVIPVGLEKQVAGNVIDVANKMREPVESLNNVYSMFLLTGHIVTEIEALKILADVSVFQAAAGGTGGAEGSVRLVCRGTREQVERALKVIREVQGEPPFLE